MKLQVEQAKEQIGRIVPFLCTTSGKDLGDVSAFPWSRHDITISGELRYDGQHYVVNGTITTNGQYECSRCLTDTNYTHTVPFEETFGVTHSNNGDDDIISFDGEEIDLTETIRETLIINEPSQVLCQDDCKGLCVHCGANLNVSPCSCESFVVDPRFAELRALLDEKDDRLS